MSNGARAGVIALGICDVCAAALAFGGRGRLWCPAAWYRALTGLPERLARGWCRQAG